MVGSPKEDLFQEATTRQCVCGELEEQRIPASIYSQMHPNTIRFCHKIKNNKNHLERRFFLTPFLRDSVVLFCPPVVAISTVLQVASGRS